MANTYGDLFGDPIQVIHPTVYIYAVDDDGEVPVRQLSCVLTPTEGAMEIARGLPGEKGAQGEPARPYIDQGDILNQAVIDGLELTGDDAGKAWRNLDTNALHYWTGNGWIVHANAFGAEGPRGQFGMLKGVEIEMIGKDLPASATLTGTVNNQVMHVKIPKVPGPIGPPGPRSKISEALDFLQAPEFPMATGHVLTYDAETKTWSAVSPVRTSGTYSLAAPQWTGFTSTFDESRLIGELVLPPSAFPTYLDIDGMVRVDNFFLGAGVGIDVRLGSPTNGTVVARGLHRTDGGKHVLPIGNWTDVSGGPGYPAGVVIPANHTGNAGTLYITARRRSGLGNWGIDRSEAMLTVRRFPL